MTDGKRNVQEIRDAVSAIYGLVPLDLVLEYLRAWTRSVWFKASPGKKAEEMVGMSGQILRRDASLSS